MQIARDIYNSDDADLFYREVWGGEDTSACMSPKSEPIAAANRRTVQQMAELAGELTPDSRVIDLGAGYGGSVRYLAKHYGCHCVALNLSDVENERDRQMNREAGLDDQIDVVEDDFASLDFPDESFELAWSQEAILHSGNRDKVCADAARVLKPGGRFVFTDPMQADDASSSALQAIYDRLNLSSMASPSFYRTTLSASGMREVGGDVLVRPTQGGCLWRGVAQQQRGERHIQFLENDLQDIPANYQDPDFYNLMFKPCRACAPGSRQPDARR